MLNFPSAEFVQPFPFILTVVFAAGSYSLISQLFLIFPTNLILIFSDDFSSHKIMINAEQKLSKKIIISDMKHPTFKSLRNS